MGWLVHTRPANLPNFLPPMSNIPSPSRYLSLISNCWTVLALFTLLTLVCQVDRFVMGALLNPLKAEFHLSDEQLGRLNLIFVIAYLALVPVAGFFGDRLPRKWFVLLGLIVWSIASLGSGLSHNFAALLFWRAVVGVGEGIYSSLYPSWIADTFGPNLRSLAFAVIVSTGQVGAWIAYAGGGAVAAASSWHHALLVAGVPGLILALAVIFLREPHRGAADGYTAAAAIEKPTPREIGALFRHPKYVLYLTGYTLRMLGVSGVFYWGAVYLHRQFGINNKEATAFIGLAYLVAGTPGIFVAGLLAGRLARTRRGVFAFWLMIGEIGSAFSVISMLLFAKDPTTAKWLLLSQMFFAGNSWGAINPLLFEFAPIRVRGLAASSAAAFQTIGSAFLASEVIGLASDHWGIQRALFFAPAGYLAASVIWSILGSLQVREGRNTPASEASAGHPILQEAQPETQTA